MLASDLINGAAGVRTTLLDTAKRTWSDDELQGYLVEAVRATCMLKPDAYTRREAIPLAYGTRQALPDGGIAIFDVYENDGSGRVITLADQSLIDHQNRFWPASTYEVDAQHWSADTREPRQFTITPPNTGYGLAWAFFGAVPDAFVISDEVPLPDIYEHALKLFVMAKAYTKNSQRQDLTKADGLMNGWRQALGIKSQGQVAVAPSVQRKAAGG